MAGNFYLFVSHQTVSGVHTGLYSVCSVWERDTQTRGGRHKERQRDKGLICWCCLLCSVVCPVEPPVPVKLRVDRTSSEYMVAVVRRRECTEKDQDMWSERGWGRGVDGRKVSVCGYFFPLLASSFLVRGLSVDRTCPCRRGWTPWLPGAVPIWGLGVP